MAALLRPGGRASRQHFPPRQSSLPDCHRGQPGGTGRAGVSMRQEVSGDCGDITSATGSTASRASCPPLPVLLVLPLTGTRRGARRRVPGPRASPRCAGAGGGLILGLRPCLGVCMHHREPRRVLHRPRRPRRSEPAPPISLTPPPDGPDAPRAGRAGRNRVLIGFPSHSSCFLRCPARAPGGGLNVWARWAAVGRCAKPAGTASLPRQGCRALQRHDGHDGHTGPNEDLWA